MMTIRTLITIITLTTTGFRRRVEGLVCGLRLRAEGSVDPNPARCWPAQKAPGKQNSKCGFQKALGRTCNVM